MAGAMFELAMEPMAIGLVSLNSNSETHMTAICDAKLIYERWISRVFICYATLMISVSNRRTSFTVESPKRDREIWDLLESRYYI